MYAQFYAGMPWTELPLVALVLFLSVFAAVVVRMTLGTRRAEVDELARLPLDDDRQPTTEVRS